MHYLTCFHSSGKVAIICSAAVFLAIFLLGPVPVVVYCPKVNCQVNS